jgi:hypothetical protein
MRPETESLEGLGGTVSQRPCGVMPAWPLSFIVKNPWVNGRSWRKAVTRQDRQLTGSVAIRPLSNEGVQFGYL